MVFYFFKTYSLATCIGWPVWTDCSKRKVLFTLCADMLKKATASLPPMMSKARHRISGSVDGCGMCGIKELKMLLLLHIGHFVKKICFLDFPKWSLKCICLRYKLKLFGPNELLLYMFLNLLHVHVNCFHFKCTFMYCCCSPCSHIID